MFNIDSYLVKSELIVKEHDDSIKKATADLKVELTAEQAKALIEKELKKDDTTAGTD